jgi:hypothetical protein
MPVLEIFDECPRGHENDGRLPATARTECSQTVSAPFRVPVAVTDEVSQRSQIGIGLQNNITAIATVSPVRTTTRNVDFSAETAAAVSAVAGTTIQGDSISKHDIPVQQKTTNSARIVSSSSPAAAWF